MNVDTTQLKLAIVTEVLDRLAYGVMLLNSHYKVLYKNKIAECILAQKDGFYLGNNGNKDELRTHIRSVQPKLDALIQHALADNGQQKSRLIDTIALPRPSGNLPYLLQISPLRAHQYAQQSDKVGLILIKDSASSSVCFAHILETAFGLTDSEAQVALLSAELPTIESIAKQRNTGSATVKTQLANIFQKTRTANRAELVKLMMMLALPPYNA